MESTRREEDLKERIEMEADRRESDGQRYTTNFQLSHGQTDYLLSYPDENSFDPEQEGRFLKEKEEVNGRPNWLPSSETPWRELPESRR